MNTRPSARGHETSSSAAAIVAIMLAQGCSATHEVEKADTATSWLRACVQDDECDGVGSCLNHVCTLPCSEHRSCAAMAVGARCEAIGGDADRTCTLGCTQAADCAVLGGQFECQERTCRPRSPLDVSTQALVLEPLVATTPASSMFMDAVVSWAGDRWRLLLVAPDEMNFNVKKIIAVAEIDDAGARISRALYTEARFPVEWEGPFGAVPLKVAADGTVAIALSSGTNPLFANSKENLQFLFPDGSGSRSLDCPGRFDVLPISGASEWMVSCESDDATVSVGRYDPRSDQWSIPATSVVRERRRDEIATIALQGDDLLLFLEHSTEAGRLGRLPGAAREATRELSEVPAWREVDSTFLRSNDGPGYFSTGVSGEWLLPSWYEQHGTGGEGATYWEVRLAHDQQPTGLRVLEDGDLANPVRFRLSVAERMSLQAAQGLPGSGRIAFCYEERHRSAEGVDRMDLLLSMFDSEGTRIAGPTRIASSPRAMSSCQLSWSGSAFLVTWLEDPASSDVSSTLFARVISLR